MNDDDYSPFGRDGDQLDFHRFLLGEAGRGRQIGPGADDTDYDPFDRDDMNDHAFVLGSTGGGRSMMQVAANMQYALEGEAPSNRPSVESLGEHIQDDNRMVLGKNQHGQPVSVPETTMLSVNHDSTLFDFVAAQALACGRSVRVLSTREWLSNCYGPSDHPRPERYALFQHLSYSSTEGDCILMDRPGRFDDAPPREDLSDYLPDECFVMLNTSQDQPVNFIYDGQGYYVANPPNGLEPGDTGVILPPT